MNVMPIITDGHFFKLKINTMTIFNLQIFGEDKEQWLAMPIEDKVEWIRKYTNQQDDAVIEEFVNNPSISKDKICLTCGDNMNFVDEKPIVKKSKWNIIKI